MRAVMLILALSGFLPTIPLPAFAATGTDQNTCMQLSKFSIIPQLFKKYVDTGIVATDEQTLAFCSLFIELQKQSERAKETVEEISQKLESVNRALPPLGSIVIHDDPGGCPGDHWMDITDSDEKGDTFIGRVIVPAGNRNDGRRFGYRVPGGETHIELELENLPSIPVVGETGADGEHRHSVSIMYSKKNIPEHAIVSNTNVAVGNMETGRFIPEPPPQTDTFPAHRHTINITAGGRGVAIPNMPPYLPLHFCKRVK